MRAVKPADMNHAGVRVATVCVRRKIGEIGHYIDLLLTSTRIGLGFEIPEPSFVPNVPKTPEPQAVGVAA